jgi:TRAP-type C4-dicarboxylate transport system permease small subunit
MGQGHLGRAGGALKMRAVIALTDRLVRGAAVALLLALLVAVLLGVASRQLNAPLAWTDELAQYLLVWTGFTGWIIAARRRSHIRITVFADLLPRSAGRLLEVLTQAAIILFAAILIRYSFGLIERTWDVESIALPITSAALYVVMPLAGLALILQALAEIGEVLAGRRAVAAEPGTQPL